MRYIRITDRMIAAHDRALGSPEYDEEDYEEEEEGTYTDKDEEPQLADSEVSAELLGDEDFERDRRTVEVPDPEADQIAEDEAYARR